MKSIIFFVSTFFLFSCMDYYPPLFYIKNNSNKNIRVFNSDNRNSFGDSNLFYGDQSNYKPKEIRAYIGLTAGKSFYMLFFDEDSIDFYFKKNEMEHLAQKTFLSSYRLTMDSVNGNDTLVFNDSGTVEFISSRSKK